MSSASGLRCYRKNGQHPCACGCGGLTYKTYTHQSHRWRVGYWKERVEENAAIRARKAALKLDPMFVADRLTKLLTRPEVKQ